MKYKLKDVENIVQEDVQFGTCDLCGYMGTLRYDIMVFEDENGKEYEIETGAWEWGYYETIYDIPNYMHFAEYLTNREFSAAGVHPKGLTFFKTVFHEEIYPSYRELIVKNNLRRGI